MFIPVVYQISKTLKAISNKRVSSKYTVEPESIKSNDNDILNWLNCSNSFVLKCFIQFACTNLDGCQKEGVIF